MSCGQQITAIFVDKIWKFLLVSLFFFIIFFFYQNFQEFIVKKREIQYNICLWDFSFYLKCLPLMKLKTDIRLKSEINLCYS